MSSAIPDTFLPGNDPFIAAMMAAQLKKMKEQEAELQGIVANVMKIIGELVAALSSHTPISSDQLEVMMSNLNGLMQQADQVKSQEYSSPVLSAADLGHTASAQTPKKPKDSDPIEQMKEKIKTTLSALEQIIQSLVSNAHTSNAQLSQILQQLEQLQSGVGEHPKSSDQAPNQQFATS